MWILNFFKKRKKYWQYKLSKHAGIYEKIASELNSDAQHVYELAHGKTVKCYDDFVIIDRLFQCKILKDLALST